MDLDLTGGPIGAHWEVWTDHRRRSLTVLETPGPFDTLHDLLYQVVLEVDGQYGRQLKLPR